MMIMNIIRIISSLFHFDRTNWKAVSLCVLAAAVFWIFNAFNKSHSTTIEFPITFEYNRDRFAPAQLLPHKIKINVTGNGWDLFTKNFGFKVPHLMVPLDRPSETKKIVTSSLLHKLTGQVGSLHINYFVTDTLKIDLDVRDQHSFRLVVDLSSVSFEKGFGRVSPVVVLPDSILVDGPKNYLHQLPDSIVIRPVGENLNSNFKSELEIDIPDKDFLTRTPAIAKVIFEVGRVEQVTKKIALGGKRKFPDSISFIFQIPVDKEQAFQSASKEIVAMPHQPLPIFLRLPSYAIPLRRDSLTKK
jgi:hypothetical protein